MSKAGETAGPANLKTPIVNPVTIGPPNSAVRPGGVIKASEPTSPNLLNGHRQQLEIPIQFGGLRHAFDRVFAVLSGGIATEARVDWLRVRSTMEPIEAKLAEWAEPKHHLIAKFRLAADLLVNARKATNLNETWGSINRAAELLCSVAHDVKAEEQERTLLARMAAHEPLMMRWINHLDNDDQAAEALKEELSKLDGSAKLELYSQNWQRINETMLFSRRLWRFACVALSFTLVIAIVIAELSIDTGSDPGSPARPYLIVSLAGLFGGALSVLLTARSIKISALTYATTRFRFLIRLLLGACGAFVVFILLKAFPDVLGTGLVKPVTTGAIGIITLGVIAGFSEQLFQNALDRIAKRVPSSEPNGDQPKDGKAAKS